MKAAYYICYAEPSPKDYKQQLHAEITEIHHPFEYVMAYWNKFNKQITIVWWKELSPNEVIIARKVGSIAVNLLK